jgi:hypothetical protein
MNTIKSCHSLNYMTAVQDHTKLCDDMNAESLNGQFLCGHSKSCYSRVIEILRPVVNFTRKLSVHSCLKVQYGHCTSIKPIFGK